MELGTDIIVKINNSQFVGELNHNINHNKKMIDVSDKKSGTSQEFKPGRGNSRLVITSLIDPTSLDYGYKTAKDAYDSGALIEFKKIDSENTESGSGYIASISEQNTDDQASSFSVTIQVNSNTEINFSSGLKFEVNLSSQQTYGFKLQSSFQDSTYLVTWGDGNESVITCDSFIGGFWTNASSVDHTYVASSGSQQITISEQDGLFINLKGFSTSGPNPRSITSVGNIEKIEAITNVVMGPFCQISEFPTLASIDYDFVILTFNSVLLNADISSAGNIANLDLQLGNMTGVIFWNSTVDITSINLRGNQIDSTLDWTPLSGTHNSIDINLAANSMSSSNVDGNIIAIEANISGNNGVLSIGESNAAPTSLSLTARDDLISRGWTVNITT